MCEDHGGSLHGPGVSSHREACQEPRLDEKADSRHRDREVLVEAPASRDESFRKCILATRAALLAVAILYAAFRGRTDDTLQVGADPPQNSCPVATPAHVSSRNPLENVIPSLSQSPPSCPAGM